MRIRLLSILGIFLLATQAQAADDLVLKSQKDKASYIIGLDIGRTFKNQGLDIDPKILARGMKDSLAGKNLLLSDEEIRETMTAFQKEITAKQEAQAKKLSEKNQKEGEAFLAENKKKEGVKILPSGLQYKVIKEGSGKKPKATDTVTTNYKGTLIDGTEFDSSYKRGKPATFVVNGVIPGWAEALQFMGEGAKWQLFIPSNLAYGERGAGREIGPNATLIFEVELISVLEKK
ncbi:MAG: FKBP-type peptidyl-prolyl cis-trans isomerase [Deltaproteobacteria bacterium]|nr:FKBP-type peptidyl-prolyl cis-trans isomerase [Deltaproteobacteria bacterium]